MTRRLIPFLLPGILATLILTVIPLFYTVYLSFNDYDVLTPPVFIGLQNYSRLFGDSRWASMFALTLIYALLAALMSMLVGVFAAWVFKHDSLPLVRTLRTAFAAPLLFAPVAAGAIASLFFNPNIGGLRTELLVDPNQTLWALLIVDTWRWAPLTCLVVIVLINQMPNAEGSFRAVLARLIVPLSILFLFRLIEGFKLFDLIAIMTGGGPLSSTTNLTFYTYQMSVQRLDVGYGAAVAVVLLLLTLPPLWGMWWLARRRERVA
jgi:multiple sugar transport system permease protein